MTATRLGPGSEIGLSSSRARLLRVSANLVGAAGAGYFAYIGLRYYAHTHRLIDGAFLFQQTWVVVAYLIRRPARTVSYQPMDWVLAFGGTFGGVLFRPTGLHPGWAVNVGIAVQLVGLSIWVVSFLTLGRCFGFAAADRGLVRRGPYAVVRHPIYASYILLQASYLLQSAELWNALVLVFVTGCNIGRAVAEERLLATSSQYEAYRSRVRWRLFPGVW